MPSLEKCSDKLWTDTSQYIPGHPPCLYVLNYRSEVRCAGLRPPAVSHHHHVAVLQIPGSCLNFLPEFTLQFTARLLLQPQHLLSSSVSAPPPPSGFLCDLGFTALDLTSAAHLRATCPLQPISGACFSLVEVLKGRDKSGSSWHSEGGSNAFKAFCQLALDSRRMFAARTNLLQNLKKFCQGNDFQGTVQARKDPWLWETPADTQKRERTEEKDRQIGKYHQAWSESWHRHHLKKWRKRT